MFTLLKNTNIYEYDEKIYNYQGLHRRSFDWDEYFPIDGSS
jgi:hypothetical protein